MQKFRNVLGINDTHKKNTCTFKKLFLFLFIICQMLSCIDLVQASVPVPWVPVRAFVQSYRPSSWYPRLQYVIPNRVNTTVTVLNVFVFTVKLMTLSTCFVLMCS